MDIPIYDNHIHMDPRGRNINAIEEFKNAGGTGFTLVNLPYDSVTISSADDFAEQYAVTISQAEKVRDELDMKVNVAVGPYPVLLIPLSERFGIDVAEDIMIKGMDIAATMVSEGLVNAIGEIGRPHFPVSGEITDASERIFIHGMEVAKDVGCPVIVHCESEENTMRWLADAADKAGMRREMVIKHLSPPLVTENENHGVMPSIAASRSGIRTALSKGDRFMLETDYIDSPERPDVVMPVTTVPKRINGMFSSGEMDEETIWRICHDIPKALYGN